MQHLSRFEKQTARLYISIVGSPFTLSESMVDREEAELIDDALIEEHVDAELEVAELEVVELEVVEDDR